MKSVLVSLALLLALTMPTPVIAHQPSAPVVAPENFRETLSKATLALYIGKQSLGIADEDEDIDDPAQSSKFESHFICTVTVIATDGEGTYVALTTGHCFMQEMIDKGYSFYVSETVEKNPVLKLVEPLKYEDNGKYDYGLVKFESNRTYPVVKVDFSSPVPPLGTQVLNANFSLGIAKEVSVGPIVSGEIHNGNEKYDHRYLVQLPFGPGASGSPIVDEDTHKIVGLVEGMFRGTQMAAIIIVTGPNLADFIEDDSVGLKPLPKSESKPVITEIKKDDQAAKEMTAVGLGLISIGAFGLVFIERKKILALAQRLKAKIKK